MKKTTLLFLSLALILGISSCKDDDAPTLGTAPTEADAAFTFAPSAANANIIEFSATNAGFTYSWDFDNGSNSNEQNPTAEYPNKGSYEVTLTVFNSGGSASSTQTVEIAEDDASLLSNPLFTLLTGGVAGGGSKTWVVDSTRAGHFGVGATESLTPIHWQAGAAEKPSSGLYSDKYTFKLNGFKFDQVTGGSVFVNSDQMGNFPESFENSGDATAPFPDQLDESWAILEGEDTTLTISGEAFLGFYTGVRTYQILNITENELYIKYLDTENPDLSWFIRLVPIDFPVDGGGGGGGGDPTFGDGVLPMDFESVEPVWEAFGNSTYEYVANPDKSGINTSSKVLKTVHGNETWAGMFVDLKDHLDFTNDGAKITLKVWAPVTGVMRMKIENIDKTKEFVEKDVNITTAEAWTEVSIDFSEAVLNKYARLVLFPGWNVADAGTFYIDDIKQN